jgi:hypothetical protein
MPDDPGAPGYPSAFSEAADVIEETVERIEVLRE